jgi:hypothetical protein
MECGKEAAVKRLLALLVVLGLALGIPANALADAAQAFYLASQFNIQSLTATGCQTFGNGGALAGSGNGPADLIDYITTGGVSTATITAVNSANPFAAVTAGDIFILPPVGDVPQAPIVIQSVTNPNTVVATAVVTIAVGGVRAGWYHQVCGTLTTSGWVDVSQFYEKDLLFQGDTIGAAAGIDVQWQCRMAGPFAQPVQVYPACASGACNTVQNYTADGLASRTNVVIYEPWNQCRALFNVHSGSPGTNSITIMLTGRVRKP